jgi:asparagine synthase (glutamine-hydrolysing)
LGVNGEIYNHREIRKKFEGSYEFMTGSDCEVILALYHEKKEKFLDDINGIFAFGLYDEDRRCYLIARDHIGIIPLVPGMG